MNSEPIKSADFVIIDELRRLELKGHGWRRNKDSLLSIRNAIILVVIRRELKETFQQIYAGYDCLELEALEEKSAYEVITLLKNTRQSK